MIAIQAKMRHANLTRQDLLQNGMKTNENAILEKP